MSSSHNKNNDDGYLRPVFSMRNKLRRLMWNITWAALCQWTPIPLHGWRIFILRLFGAQIGPKNFIYPGCKIWAPWLLKTDSTVTIASGVVIYNPGGITLGHHTTVSQDAYLCGATHDYNDVDFTYIKKEIVTEAYVWICAKATVLAGVRCMEGSVLGATSITSKNLEAWTVYAGNPSKPLTTRNNFLVNQPI